MIIPVNILCKHSRVNNPWRTILPTKTHMDARHPRTELKTMSSLLIVLLILPLHCEPRDNQNIEINQKIVYVDFKRQI